MLDLSPTNAGTSMLIKNAQLQCWPFRGEQVSHQRWIWRIHCTQARKYASDWSTLALKPRADINRSPKQGYQWPHKKNWCPFNLVWLSLIYYVTNEASCIAVSAPINYRPQTKFAKVMFLHLSVSHSVHGTVVSASVHAGIHTSLGRHPPPPGQTPTLRSACLGDTGNKRAVRILLECILILTVCYILKNRIQHCLMGQVFYYGRGLRCLFSRTVKRANILSHTVALFTKTVRGWLHQTWILFYFHLRSSKMINCLHIRQQLSIILSTAFVYEC